MIGYNFEHNRDDYYYEFDPDSEDIIMAMVEIISKEKDIKDAGFKKLLFEILDEKFDVAFNDRIFESWYDDLKEYFEPIARKEFEDTFEFLC